MNDSCDEPLFIPCQLCGCRQSALFYEEKGMTFRRCSDCGVIFLNPRAAEDEYLALYKAIDDNALAFDGPGKASLTRIKGFRRGIGIIERLKPGGKLLDVGCGDGRFLEMISQQGAHDLYGLELSHVAARSVSRFLGIDVRPCTLKEAGYPDNFFDVVVMWDVLEHVYDSVKELAEVRRVLKDDGLFMARIPNLTYFRIKQILAGRFLKSRGRTIYHGGRHLTYLNAKTAYLLMEKSGFNVISLQPARTEYGISSPRLIVETAYHALSSAIYVLSGGRKLISIDLLILAQQA
jgi:2-polyprenyl-3-methyl-5-hydroxy-6-metoxy-1,4-benzoquinol methylase